MAEGNPLFMDIQDVYSGDELALPYRDIMGEGVVGSGDLAVSAGAGNSVDVAAGAAWVLGDTNPDLQPCYRVFNDAVVNLGISPDPSNPRKVLVVAQITDEAFDGVGREWEIQALHGTPAGSPTEPTLPDSALELALIDVPAAAASSAAYTITSRRVRARVGGGQATDGGSHCLAHTSGTLIGAAINSTWTEIPLGSDATDDEDMHDTSTNTARITIVTPGVYIITGWVNFSDVAGGTRRDVAIRWNGATELNRHFDMDLVADHHMNVATSRRLAAGDYVSLWIFQDSGGNRDINYAQLEVSRIGT